MFNYYPSYYPPQNTAPASDGRIWVQNETAAEAYLLAAGGVAILWDSSRPVFYEKRADATGRPLPMIAYKYEKCAVEREKYESNTSEYKAQIDALEARIKALEERGNNEADKQSNADNTAI